MNPVLKLKLHKNVRNGQIKVDLPKRKFTPELLEKLEKSHSAFIKFEGFE